MKSTRLVVSLALTMGALFSASCSSEDSGSPSGTGATAGKGGSSSGGSGSSVAGSKSAAAGTGSSSAGTATTSGGSSGVSGSSSGVSGSSSGVSGSSSGGSGNGQAGSSSGGSGSSGSGSGGTGSMGDRCAAAGLDWKTANKTNFESYPDPGSEECVKYSGCDYVGEFAFCDDKHSEEWVSQHNIVAVFPANGLENHDLCIKKGDKTMVVTVLDTCGDSDCDGCCTENLGDADALVDLEKYTNERWGLDDGEIQFADLGKNDAACN